MEPVLKGATTGIVAKYGFSDLVLVIDVLNAVAERCRGQRRPAKDAGRDCSSSADAVARQPSQGRLKTDEPFAFAAAMFVTEARATICKPATLMLGWSSWNGLKNDINESVIQEMADAMVCPPACAMSATDSSTSMGVG
jgi:hypothetical protein